MEKPTAKFDIELLPGNKKDAMKAVGGTSGDLWRVPYSALHILPGFNVREPGKDLDAHIRSIADSIKENGFYDSEPLGVFVREEDGENKIYVTEGHCRHAALGLAIAEGAPIETVPVVAAPRGTTIEDLTVKLWTSNSGKELTAYGKALVVKRLLNFGWDESEIARKLAVTKRTVENFLTFLEAPAAVRKIVASGEASLHTAVETIKEHGASKAAEKLTKGLEEAKKAGKSKVTKKHMGDTDKQKKNRAESGLVTAIKVFLEWADNGRDPASPKLDEAIEIARKGLLEKK
jgi:ParB-like chromosome segregation protein Spo0J